MNPDEEPTPQQPSAPQPETPSPRPHVPPRPQKASGPAPEIPMPGETRIGGVRAHVGRKNIDLDLRRIKRRKRFGYVITALTVLFVAFIVAPVTWVAVYAFIDPPTNVLMIRRAMEGEAIRHRPVPLAQVSPHVVRAVIAAEDNNFCSHSGFDFEAIQDAMASNARGKRTRGASTISQQVAKNLFLWPDQSWVRKGLEVYFTVLIEAMWPKRRIMEAYLNVAEWGDGNFGIEAASQARFGIPASRLSQLQAARLAAVLPSPNRWRADRPGPYVQRRSAMLVARARTVKNEHLAGCVLLLDSVRPRK